MRLGRHEDGWVYGLSVSFVFLSVLGLGLSVTLEMYQCHMKVAQALLRESPVVVRTRKYQISYEMQFSGRRFIA